MLESGSSAPVEPKDAPERDVEAAGERYEDVAISLHARARGLGDRARHVSAIDVQTPSGQPCSIRPT